MSELDRLRAENKILEDRISNLERENDGLNNKIDFLDEDIYSLENPEMHIRIDLTDKKTLKDVEIDEFLQENWEKLTYENLKAIV